MNCSEARQRLLEADPEELGGERDSPLSIHILSCPQCRAAAERILAHAQGLREMMAAVRPRVPTPEALQRAQWQARLRTRRRLVVGLAPALAAAGIAGVLIVGNGGLTTTEPVPPSAEVIELRQPLVENAPGQQVAVFETDNRGSVVFLGGNR
jgi:anti-sigma factor RsiW